MKHLIVVSTLLLTSFTLEAQTLKETLADALNKFERTDTLQNKLDAVNRIDLIATKWNDQWVAHYYSAYAKVVTSYLLKDEKQRDSFLDKAELSIAEVKKLGGISPDELLVMEAYLANARLSVKPNSRWKKYGALFDTKLEEAKAINGNNPRIYFLQGQSLFFTPKAFGGGANKAVAHFEKAAVLFGAEEKGKLEKPYWGDYMNEFYISQCKKDKK
jgi:hypothetical protein